MRQRLGIEVPNQKLADEFCFKISGKFVAGYLSEF